MFGVLFGFHIRVDMFRIVTHDEIVIILSQRICVKYKLKFTSCT